MITIGSCTIFLVKVNISSNKGAHPTWQLRGKTCRCPLAKGNNKVAASGLEFAFTMSVEQLSQNDTNVTHPRIQLSVSSSLKWLPITGSSH